MRKFAKGLYYLETGERLPEDVQIVVKDGLLDPRRLFEPGLRVGFEGAKRMSWGADDEVVCSRSAVAGEPTASITWITFYRWNPFLVLTYRPEVIAA